MNRRQLMQLVAGGVGLSMFDSNDEDATDSDVREAVEQVEPADGEGDVVERLTRSDDWPAGPVYSRYDLAAEFEAADIQLGSGFDHQGADEPLQAVVDIELRTDLGFVSVTLDADDARALAWDLLNEADAAEAETEWNEQRRHEWRDE